MKILKIISALAVVALSLAANATTYYVSTTGDDSWDGTSEETALATPGKGISKAKAGDTVLILPGTYKLSERLSIGTSDLTLKGSTGNPRDVVLDGQAANVGMEVQSADGITISSLTVSNAYETLTYLNRAAGIHMGDRKGPTDSGKTKLVTNCVFTCCKANSNNGQYILSLDVTSRAVDCIFENNLNTSGESGEVVRMNHGGELVGCTIEGNAGRGVYGNFSSESGAIATSIVVRACTIRNNTGRGIYNVPQVFDSWIEGSSADNGAGLYFEKDKAALLPADFRVTVSNTTFVGNTATKNGSAAYVQNRCEFIGCTMTNNVGGTSSGDGAVIYADVSDASATSMVVRACTIRGNTGRCLYNVPTVRDSWIEGGSAETGAGIYYHPEILKYLPADFRVTVSNTTFLANAATTGFGGAISWGHWSTVISNVVIDSCSFLSNTVSRASDNWRGGGAISICPGTVGENVVIRNSLFEGNAQLNAGTDLPGAAVHITRDTREISGGGTIRIENCTFVGNRNESGKSDSVYLTGRYSPIAYVTNCVFACNLKKVDGAMVETAGLSSSSDAVAYSYIYPASSTTFGDTVINGTKAPNFQEGTWIPSGGSPMRDKGVLLSWMVGAKDLQRDANGKAIRDRVLGSAPDMGCFEYQPLGLLLILR